MVSAMPDNMGDTAPQLIASSEKSGYTVKCWCGLVEMQVVRLEAEKKAQSSSAKYLSRSSGARCAGSNSPISVNFS